MNITEEMSLRADEFFRERSAVNHLFLCEYGWRQVIEAAIADYELAPFELSEDGEVAYADARKRVAAFNGDGSGRTITMDLNSYVPFIYVEQLLAELDRAKRVLVQKTAQSLAPLSEDERVAFKHVFLSAQGDDGLMAKFYNTARRAYDARFPERSTPDELERIIRNNARLGSDSPEFNEALSKLVTLATQAVTP